MKIIESGLTFSYEPGVRKETRLLILHHAAADADVDTVHQWHLSRGWAGIAYHYYVRKDGSVYRGRAEDMIGGHTRDHNGNSIGVCFEGNFENETMGIAQLKAGLELLADIKERYPDITVVRHADCNATACPGKNFPAALFGATDANAAEFAPENDAKETTAKTPKNPASWAKDACDEMVKMGLFQGDETGDFKWDQPLTRQELAVIFWRFMSKNVTKR